MSAFLSLEDNAVYVEPRIADEEKPGDAIRRSLQLMVDVLGLRSVVDLTVDRGLYVRGASGKLYFVTTEFVYEKEGRYRSTLHTYCLVSAEWVPPVDALLARYLLISTNEELFLEQANRLY